MIKWIRSLFTRILTWSRRKLRLGRESTYQARLVSEDPETLDEGIVYVVGEGGHLWHAVFLCPCGCHATISLNLLPDDKPCWRLTNDNGPTFSPSISRRVGCRSHFFLREGRVQWVLPQSITHDTVNRNQLDSRRN